LVLPLLVQVPLVLVDALLEKLCACLEALLLLLLLEGVTALGERPWLALLGLRDQVLKTLHQVVLATVNDPSELRRFHFYFNILVY